MTVRPAAAAPDAPGAPGGPRPTAFVGDAHLLPGEETTTAFIAFVRQAPGRFERLVLVGDIFDLWIARPHLHEEHHVRVLEELAAARLAGLAVDYAVGNRDYAVETLPCAPFDRIASEVLTGGGSPPAWLAEHGDLSNEADRAYHRWRAFSRHRLVLAGFLGLPGFVGRPLGTWLERRMRTTNLAYKRSFPTEHVERRAARLLAAGGARFLVLGHFHQELRLTVPGGEVLVLPDWKRARRHLEWRPEDGSMRFANSLGA